MANIIVPRRREDFFKENGDPTNRLMNWIELVTGQTNETTQLTEAEQSVVSISTSQIAQLTKRIEQLEQTIISNNIKHKTKDVDVLCFSQPYKEYYKKLNIDRAIINVLTVNSTLTSANINTTGNYSVDGVQVVSNQGAAVSNATGGATIDAEARTALNALLARVRTHGLIVT